ncbi:MAG: flavodoxin family protein [Abditibacteriota bacterium]|nr:flavodoxin family protein [Abditibacteriota bacterium]
MSRILSLNGSPRKNGATASLMKALAEGARENGNEIKEDYITSMDIKPCIGCDSCLRTRKGCVQKNDDMAIIYDDLLWADVVVFVSPQYWGTITGQLKVVFDRSFALFNQAGWENMRRKCVLLMTARGGDYSMALDFYGILTKYLGWESLGEVLGAGKEEEARAIGADIG